MIIDKHKKQNLIDILNELPLIYIKDLSSLVDINDQDIRLELIDNLIKNIKNPVKIRNYFHNLNDFQKEIVSDVLYNLNGVYIENYIVMKYEKLPEFERKTILFTKNTYPSYLSLFIYNKQLIPLDLQKILKTFIPKPKIWKIQESDSLIYYPDSIKNETEMIIFYTCMFSQLNIFKINKKNFKFIETKKMELNNILHLKSISLILKLLYHSNLISILNKKIIPNYTKNFDIELLEIELNNTLINNRNYLISIYKKRSFEYIQNIIKFRNIVISNFEKLDKKFFFNISEIYKFIEINNYNSLKKIDLTYKEKFNDLNDLIDSLQCLEMINIYKKNGNKFVMITNTDKESIYNKSKKEIMLLENFEIIIINKLNDKNKILIETFCDLKTNKNYIIRKDKILKLLNKGLNIGFLIKFLRLISQNNIPNSLESYLNDLDKNKILINLKDHSLSANSLIIETIVHNKKFKNNVEKISSNKLLYDDIIKKRLITYLISLEYYVKMIY